MSEFGTDDVFDVDEINDETIGNDMSEDRMLYLRSFIAFVRRVDGYGAAVQLLRLLLRPRLYATLLRLAV